MSYPAHVEVLGIYIYICVCVCVCVCVCACVRARKIVCLYYPFFRLLLFPKFTVIYVLVCMTMFLCVCLRPHVCQRMWAAYTNFCSEVCIGLLFLHVKTKIKLGRDLIRTAFKVLWILFKPSDLKYPFSKMDMVTRVQFLDNAVYISGQTGLFNHQSRWKPMN